MDNLWSSISGHRALILGDTSLDFAQQVAGRFDDVVVVGDFPRLNGPPTDLSPIINARRADVEQPPLPWDPGFFDGLFALNFLFRRLNWQSWLDEGLRVLQPRGKLLLVEPYPKFRRSSGCEREVASLWRDFMDQIPTATARELISPDEIAFRLKNGDIHHIRTYNRLDVLGTDAENWLPTSQVRHAFLNRVLLPLKTRVPGGQAANTVAKLSDTFQSCSELELPVKTFSAMKRRTKPAILTPVLDRQEQTEITSEHEPKIPQPSASQIPAEPEDVEPWKTIWKQSPNSVTDEDLLAIVIEDAGITDTLRKTCRHMLKQYGTVALSRETTPKKLAKSFGLNRQQAIRLVSAFELGRRFLTTPNSHDVVLLDSDDVFKYLRKMGSLKKEQLRGLFLDARGKLLLDDVLALGSLTTSTVNPRDVFAPALKSYASAVILAHNHPSGDTKPSTEDIHLTKQLKQAGDSLGVELVDHIIIAGKSYLSMAEQKLL
jgi:DNA repair protein RadC